LILSLPNYPVCSLENAVSYAIKNFCTYIKYSLQGVVFMKHGVCLYIVGPKAN